MTITTLSKSTKLQSARQTDEQTVAISGKTVLAWAQRGARQTDEQTVAISNTVRRDRQTDSCNIGHGADRYNVKTITIQVEKTAVRARQTDEQTVEQ